MSKATVPTQEEVLSYFESQSNWGRWGAEDQLGTVNLLTKEKRRQAAALVRDGVTVSCAWPLTTELPGEEACKFLHYMIYTGETYTKWAVEGDPMQEAADFIGMEYHGFSITHVDALSHVFWKGQMYNGLPSELITAQGKATVESVHLLSDGVVSRGVLLDIARLRNVPWLEPGDAIMPEDLEAAEKAEGIKVESGDILFIRTGHLGRHHNAGPLNLYEGNPGSHAACIPWFRQRDIAMLGSDVANDVQPSGYDNLLLPVHAICIPSLGLWLIDNANLEELSQACAQRNRWEFQLVIAPLRILYGTGSPINPIAVF